MGFFSTTRDPQDPRQLQIAVHELGHAWAWKDSGLTIVAGLPLRRRRQDLSDRWPNDGAAVEWHRYHIDCPTSRIMRT
jgi:hypothetical protein